MNHATCLLPAAAPIAPGVIALDTTPAMTRQLSLTTGGAASPRVAQVLAALTRTAAGRLGHGTVPGA